MRKLNWLTWEINRRKIKKHVKHSVILHAGKKIVKKQLSNIEHESITTQSNNFLCETIYNVSYVTAYVYVIPQEKMQKKVHCLLIQSTQIAMLFAAQKHSQLYWNATQKEKKFLLINKEETRLQSLLSAKTHDYSTLFSWFNVSFHSFVHSLKFCVLCLYLKICSLVAILQTGQMIVNRFMWVLHTAFSIIT